MNKRVKTAVVVFGAVILSTVAIQASDILSGVSGGLAGLAIESQGPCGTNAVQVSFGSHAICVDTFEASPSALCTHSQPLSAIETKQNLQANSCTAQSLEGVIPWRYVSLTEAQQLCARNGKRLPTNEEWYKAVSGLTNIESCVIDKSNSDPVETGSVECVTPSGVSDMVGNVWEWVEAEINEGIYNDRSMPESGYVSLVDTNGVVLETSISAGDDFGEDYAWTNKTGVRGVIRGGFYGSGSDAGLYTLNASVPLDFRTTAIGFRCVKDL